jgi:hypothetical protein
LDRDIVSEGQGSAESRYSAPGARSSRYHRGGGDVISRFTAARGDGRRVGRANQGWSGGDPVIAEFIRTRGITRCPTACVLPTQGSIDAADRAALEQHAITQEKSRLAKAAARARLFWRAPLPPQRDK